MLSIIVLSSDGYSDCWEPFFELFKHNFPWRDGFELILSTNTKDYVHEGLEINVMKHGMEASWSKRLKDSLKHASHDNVCVIVEDFFIFSKMDPRLFDHSLQLLDKEPTIDHIRLLYKPDKISLASSPYEHLGRIRNPSKYRFLYLPGLWRKEVLNNYVVEFESPFMSEKMGDPRSWILNDGFYALLPEYMGSKRFYDCATSGAIIKGKWGDWLPEKLANEPISIDYSIRGFKGRSSNKKARNSIYKDLLSNPGLTFKSLFSLTNSLKARLKRKR